MQWPVEGLPSSRMKLQPSPRCMRSDPLPLGEGTSSVARNDEGGATRQPRHCEERSDEAIHGGALNPARRDHGLPRRPHGLLAMTKVT